ncbi:MAG: hypothetical protein LBC82_00085 [Oscillospiraceae bacterium]|jgi:hypothetical protein|nr:hypothetical protein [Oscillospiraceae bacterium]
MSKGLGFLILGILAILGGAIFAALVIKNKLAGNRNIDFDDFDDFEHVVDDAELEHFLNEKKDAEAAKEEED